MNQPSPKMRQLARSLIEAEADAAWQGTMQVCEKFAPELSTLLGKSGYTALLARAHALASQEVPILKTWRVGRPGKLEVVEGARSESQVSALPKNDDLARGGLLLVAHLIHLLHGFLGDYFTLRIVRNVWSKLDLENFEFE